jgi:hypothetical protein
MSFAISVERRDSSDRTLSPSKLAGAITNSQKSHTRGGLHYQTVNFVFSVGLLFIILQTAAKSDRAKLRATLSPQPEDEADSFSPCQMRQHGTAQNRSSAVLHRRAMALSRVLSASFDASRRPNYWFFQLPS